MNAVAMTVSQVRYVNKAFWRNPASAFFTFAFPLMFLMIFTLARPQHGSPGNAGQSTRRPTTLPRWPPSRSSPPATTTSPSALTFQRDAGVLKRTNGTPMPAAVYMGGRIVHALLVSVAAGRADRRIRQGFLQRRDTDRDAPCGSCHAGGRRGGFCALGLAVTSVIPNFDAAPASSTRRSCRCSSCRGSSFRSAQHPVVDLVDGPGISGEAFRRGYAGRFHRHVVQLDRCGDRGGLGTAGLLLAIRFFSWEPRTSQLLRSPGCRPSGRVRPPAISAMRPQPTATLDPRHPPLGPNPCVRLRLQDVASSQYWRAGNPADGHRRARGAA